MPRSFDIATETAAGVVEVQEAFRDRRYWLARLAEYGGDSMTLDSLDLGGDGSVVVRTTQDLRQDILPGGIARLLPGNTKIIRTEWWRPGTAGAAHGEFTISAQGVPSSGSGIMVLEPIDPESANGSRLRIRGTLEVRIPVVGGRIERYVADMIASEVPQMQRFTADWIAGKS